MTASIESKLAVDAQPRCDLPLSSDDADLAALGYEQKMHRTMGSFTSFALAFSMVSINTGVVTLFSDPFTRVGGIGILF